MQLPASIYVDLRDSWISTKMYNPPPGAGGGGGEGGTTAVASAFSGQA